MKGIPPAGTEALDGKILSRPWYDFLLGLSRPVAVPLPPYNVANLPANPADNLLVMCSDESGGAVPVFSFGGQWLRVTDRAVAS